jgi:hypothetical protein
VRVFILLANEPADASSAGANTAVQNNALIADVAASFPNVELLRPHDFMTAAEAAAQMHRHHFDRMVYFRVFEHVLARATATSPSYAAVP